MTLQQSTAKGVSHPQETGLRREWHLGINSQSLLSMLPEGSSSLGPLGTKSKLSLLQNSLKPFHQDQPPPRACASPSVTSTVFLHGVMVAP